ncbi:alpha/beta hydrolase [Arenicella chitinivorans]|uniref:Alpha/beta hydrolase n=1 Tax=Arenicella chitinivorans TaxID=1329800 RepID=A0A918RLB3_9GAMM|nr:alpha/beta hydrolase [Arenicella chitinivorans]GHA01518.1 alpha/beta hydrolase [Arenicella chitinivorans]
MSTLDSKQPAALAGNQPTVSSTALDDLNPAVAEPSAWLRSALTVPREEGYVQLSGCQIHYFRWGDTSKPGIIMIHGFLAHARCFAFIAPYLTDYHVVAFDMSGMGDSGTRSEYPIDQRVDELIGVAERTGLFEHDQKPVIVAHSYGGQVGVETMHRHAARFDGLIICDLMVMRPEVLAANAARFRPPGNQQSNKPNKVYASYEEAKARFVLAPPQPVGHAELLDFMAYHSLRKVNGGWSWKFDPSVFRREAGFEKRWAETGHRIVTAPGRKAVVYGRESMLFNDDSANYLRELIAELRATPFPIVDIPHAHHHLMLDQPVALVASLKSILSLWQSAPATG